MISGLILTIKIAIAIAGKLYDLHESGVDKQVADEIHDLVTNLHDVVAEHHDKLEK